MRKSKRASFHRANTISGKLLKKKLSMVQSPIIKLEATSMDRFEEDDEFFTQTARPSVPKVHLRERILTSSGRRHTVQSGLLNFLKRTNTNGPNKTQSSMNVANAWHKHLCTDKITESDEIVTEQFEDTTHKTFKGLINNQTSNDSITNIKRTKPHDTRRKLRKPLSQIID